MSPLPQPDGLTLRYQPLHTTSPLFQLYGERVPLQSFLVFDSPNYLAAEGAHALASEHFERAWASAKPLTGDHGKAQRFIDDMTYAPSGAVAA